MKTGKNSIVLVEDDKDLGMLLSEYLILHNFDVRLCSDAESAPTDFSNDQLLILDVMLPKQSGFEFAKKVKKRFPKLPIIFLTAKSQKKDIIEGLKLGADDYITKPFEIDELILRIKNLIKRTGKSGWEINIGNLTLDTKNLTLSNNKDQEIQLTEREFLILELLVQNTNQLTRRKEVLEKVWGEDDYFHGRSMDVFIVKLRKYLKLDSSISLKNIRGIGFKLEVEKPIK